MNDLSIIIVNYNVRYFLRQCLQSIYDSECEYKYDIWVVDNNSKDGSVEMLQSEFPEVKLIENKENLGFSKANNQALLKTDSKYTLVLNPDTIIKRDTIQKCLTYLISNPNVGALGPKLLDGRGNYLPESKRGLPTPWVAFCKMTKLNTLFPNSSIFNNYYLGHLNKEEVNEVEVLTGAFMMMPKDLVKELNGFDEDFFMYGEDIDLSYRIAKKGKKLIYFPDSSIIHYKGESTKKSSLNYVKHFYNSMLIFANKHFGSGSKWGLLLFLKLGVLFSAFISLLRNRLSSFFRMLVDAGLITGASWLFANFWSKFKYGIPDYYRDIPLVKHLFLFVLTWLMIVFIFGHYDRKASYRKYGLGLLFAFLSTLLVYSLLPENLRFGRVLILSMIAIGSVIIWMTKKFYNSIQFKSFSFVPETRKRIFIIGSVESARQVKALIAQQRANTKVLGFINPESSAKDAYLANLSDLEEAIQMHQINELIFCSKELETDQIFYWMTKLGSRISFKIASKDNESLLGSDSKDRMGQWFTLNLDYRITDVTRMRFKRILDIILSVFVLVFSPVLLLLKKGIGFIGNAFKVLTGQLSWVGYDLLDPDFQDLPSVKKGIFTTEALSEYKSETDDQRHQKNVFYAKNYAIWQDLEIFWKNLIA